MSFRLFAYYCAICGAWAAFFGWILSQWLQRKPTEGDTEFDIVMQTGMRGMFLGLAVAFGLSFLDATWVFGLRRIFAILLRVGVAILVGALGGLVGAMFGQFLADFLTFYFSIVGWTLVGALVGLSIGAFDFLSSVVRQQDIRGSLGKLVKCLTGGTVGGLLGGILFVGMGKIFVSLYPSKAQSWLWSPSGLGFVVLGACIGLLVGLAQIILKEAWVKVEQGFRAGREMILAKEITTAGRAESCDIGLFGDPGIEKLHLRIIMKGSGYILEDCNTPGGTFINNVKVDGSAPLHNGDLIRLGKSVLRFFEKPKKSPG